MQSKSLMSNPSNWLVYLVVGKILIYLWQQFPLPSFLEKHKTVEKLHICDLCAGVWIFGILSYFLGLSLLKVFEFGYVPVISELITGAVISFVVHIFSIGWKEKFSNVVVV